MTKLFFCILIQNLFSKSCFVKVSQSEHKHARSLDLLNLTLHLKKAYLLFVNKHVSDVAGLPALHPRISTPLTDSAKIGLSVSGVGLRE